ncbi:hypothetical protein NDU88_007591 [Pleurodeles waltl]|uniref:Uncharacterized protein n=1 Tax=Pleurodeles waltl TaxID=8319 RepID=A0AAV7P2L4_PLEWA|nr:hypothetical protein NDU88_007591 [Pleurodeles waltl]
MRLIEKCKNINARLQQEKGKDLSVGKKRREAALVLTALSLLSDPNSRATNQIALLRVIRLSVNAGVAATCVGRARSEITSKPARDGECQRTLALNAKSVPGRNLMSIVRRWLSVLHRGMLKVRVF